MKYLIQYTKWNGQYTDTINNIFDTEKEFLENAIKSFEENNFKIYVLTEYEFNEKFELKQKISKLINEKFKLFGELRRIKENLERYQKYFEDQKDILNEKGLEMHKNEINDYQNKILELETKIKILDTELTNNRNCINSKELSEYLQRDLLCWHQCLPGECFATDCKNNTEVL